MAATAESLGRRWFEEVWNRGRRDAIAEMLAPDAVVHDGATHSTGPEGFYPFFDRMRATFSDINVKIEDTIAQDTAACVRWSCTMKHTGDGLGIAPTGRTLHVTGISILRASGGKLIEGWQNWDMLGMMEQIQARDKRAATYIGAS